jgi:hypothetical protein
MIAPLLEVADVIRSYGAAYLDAYGDVTSTGQRRVLRDLTRCRTAALGGHVEACDECGHLQIAYNSCRNRHCPKCQGLACARWLEARAAELLPVEYFHVVFTLPSRLGPIALQNPRIVYGTLFRAAAETMLQLAADPKHLGADIGFFAVLHTWGQNLHLHPHVHCVVPGGGIATDRSRWIACRPGFFLPVAVMRRLFRGKFLALFQDAFRNGRLSFRGQQQALADPARFVELLDSLRQTEWVVYAKPPFGGPGGPEQVLKYLSRYTHRVAISNHRLLKMEDGKVYFHWKDYAHGSVQKTMALDAVEFIRRFLQHVVPSGFVRIRHFGFLAHRCREEKLQRCRQWLAEAKTPASADIAASPVLVACQTKPATEPAADRHRCPHCGRGHMIIVERLEADPPHSPPTVAMSVPEDTS